MTTSYEAVKRWRKAHPEQAKRISRNASEARRRREGVPIRGPKKQYDAMISTLEKMIEYRVEAVRKNLRMKELKK